MKNELANKGIKIDEKKIRGILVGSETDLQGIIVLWDLKKLKLEKSLPKLISETP